MKAWFISVDTGDYGWGDFVHGETSGKGKAMFWDEWGDQAEEWIWLRAIRVPSLDDVPITEINILEHLHGETFEGEPYTEWYPICTCEVCK